MDNLKELELQYTQKKKELSFIKEKIEVEKYSRSKTVKVAFFLSMPNVGSWNGVWTGSGRKYVRIKTLKRDDFEKLDNSHYYSWGDGWGASVRLEKVLPSVAKKLEKESDGFCGYEWMIDSIIENNKITN